MFSIGGVGVHGGRPPGVVDQMGGRGCCFRLFSEGWGVGPKTSGGQAVLGGAIVRMGPRLWGGMGEGEDLGLEILSLQEGMGTP